MGGFAKGIVFTLLGMSLYSLTIAFQRWWDISRSRKQVVKFAPKLSAALEANDLEAAERAVQEHQKGHLAAAYRSVFSALKEHVSDRTLTAVEVGAVQRTIEINKLEQLARFRRGMGVLATVGATAPFVGLLGTTMGLINAFNGMATSGTGGIGAISNGVAEALVTTAFGLLVAIPAVWFFNFFTTKIDNLNVEMTYTSKEMIDYLIKGVAGEFGRSRFTREFDATSGGAGTISQ
jgi:biopolymer transport protein ExbB/biopolymer transport protein TolQ